MRTGRKSNYSPARATEVCKRMAGGQTLREVCRADDMPSPSTIMRWLREHVEFQAQYARAREDLLEFWADQIAAIADDGEGDIVTRVNERGEEYTQVDQEHINRSRLRVDTRKWLMSKLAPKKYGDKLEIEATVQNVVSPEPISESEWQTMVAPPASSAMHDD